MPINPVLSIIASVESDSTAKLYEMEKSFEPPQGSLLQKIKLEMHKHEQLKYPDPPYTYKTTQISTHEGAMTVTSVSYNCAPVGVKQLSSIQAHSVTLRKLSILAGIVNGLRFSNNYLTPDPRQRAILEDRLNKLFQKAETLTVTSEKEEMDNFINKLSHEIEDVTGNPEAEIIRQIRNAERYFVAEYKHNNILINEMTYGDSTLIQMDMPFKNSLTESQRIEFTSIHDNNSLKRPAWFRRLPAWEQDWYIEHVPKSTNDDWSLFLKIFKSSAMTHIPGINNARMNYLFMKDSAGNYEMLTHSFKIGTMVPYEMPQNVRKGETEKTAEQVLDFLNEEAQQNFTTTWKGITFPKTIKPMIFIGGLLSDTVGSGFDSHLKQEQNLAINKMKVQSKYAGAEIISGNDPMNFLRYITAESGFISEIAGRWNHTAKIMKTAREMIWFLEKKGHEGALTEDQIARLNLMREAYTQLYHLRNDFRLPRFDRNFAAFKSAYTNLLIESMAGIVSTNCKSGKDRTGLDELYRHAMQLYYHKYKRLPSYDESSKAHAKFIDIFVSLYNSLKIQESAASNTPGSFGIKDDARMLCRDIVAKLGHSYISSNLRANMNKPDRFRADEEAEAKEIAKETTQMITDSPLYIINEKARNNIVSKLAEKRLQIVELMSQLDNYINTPAPGSKEKAKSLYSTLDHMNKKIQQLEATLDKYDIRGLKNYIADLEKKYKDAINTYSRNSISKFFTRSQGKTSRYDTILESSKKSPANDDGFLDKLKRNIRKKLS